MSLPRLPSSVWLGSGVALILVGLYLVVSSRTAPDESLARVQRAGVLVVGLDPSYPPFEVVNGQGNLAGFDVDLANELARRMGVRARLVSVDFGGIFDALDVGKLDLVVGGVSPDADNEAKVRYTSAYYDDGLVAVTNHDAAGSTYGIESGSDADLRLDRLRSQLLDASFQQFDDQEQIRAAVDAGSIRGAVVDLVTAHTWAGQDPTLTIGTARLSSSPYVIATRRGDGALSRQLERILRSMLADGYVASLGTKWLK